MKRLLLLLPLLINMAAIAMDSDQPVTHAKTTDQALEHCTRILEEARNNYFIELENKQFFKDYTKTCKLLGINFFDSTEKFLEKRIVKRDLLLEEIKPLTPRYKDQNRPYWFGDEPTDRTLYCTVDDILWKTNCLQDADLWQSFKIANDPWYRYNAQSPTHQQEHLEKLQKYFNAPATTSVDDIIDIMLTQPELFIHPDLAGKLQELRALEKLTHLYSEAFKLFREKIHYEHVGLTGNESYDQIQQEIEKCTAETQTYKGISDAQERAQKLDYLQKLLTPSLNACLALEAYWKKIFLVRSADHKMNIKYYNANQVKFDYTPTTLTDLPKSTTTSITLADKTHYLTPVLHKALLQCTLCKDQYSEFGDLDFSEATIPATINDFKRLAALYYVEPLKEKWKAQVKYVQFVSQFIKTFGMQKLMHHNLLDPYLNALINIGRLAPKALENRGKLFELADYLDAPPKITIRLAELFLDSLDNTNSGLPQPAHVTDLKKKAEQLLYYPTFNDFIKDYEVKTGKRLIPNANANDFSYNTLRSKGLLKKITTLYTIAGFFTLNSGNNAMKYSTIDLSGHAIRNFRLQDLHYAGCPMVMIDLSNNHINTLPLEQIYSLRDKGYRTILHLDGNPITHLCDFNKDFWPKGILLNISLKNIRFSPAQLQLLPPVETAAQEEKRTKKTTGPWIIIHTDYGTHIVE